MGRAYLALGREEDGDQLYVVKRFGNPRARFTPEQIRENQARFRKEAEITSALCHPCIARTFSSVDEGADSYLVQEFIRGYTLEYLLWQLTPGGEHIPIPLAAHIAAQIAGALHYIHEFRGLGLVHRDLTPSNVMFAQSGEVKIIDFGIAKATNAAEDSLTRPHVVVGKFLWTPPEVVEGKTRPDRRGDLYALGLLLWYLLSGKDPEGHLEPRLHSLPPASGFNAEVSAHLDGIVCKAIDPDPDRRFQTALEFLGQMTPLIPQGYEGSKALARLLFRYQSAIETEAFGEMVAAARPLIEKTALTAHTRSKRKLLLIATITILATLAGGYTFLFSGRDKQHAPLPTSRPPVQHPAAPQPPPSPSAGQSKSFQPSPPGPPASSLVLPSPQRGHPTDNTKKGTARPQPGSGREPERTPRQSSPPPRLQTSPPGRSGGDLYEDALEALTQSNFARAIALARDSVRLRPHADAYILLGRLLRESDPAAARTALETALQLSPGNDQAARLLEGLKHRGAPP